MKAITVSKRGGLQRRCLPMVRILTVAVTLGAIGPWSAAAREPSRGSWKKIPDMAVPRWEAGTVVLDDKLYVFGGYKMPTKSCKRVDVFDPKDNSWRKLADLPSAISHMNAVLDGRAVWIAGGFKDGYKGHAISEVWRYDIDKNTCTAAPSLPEPRAGGGLALVGRRLHYIGGLKKDRDTDAAEHWVLDLEKLAKGKAKWVSAAPMPKPRNQFGAVTLNGKIYLMGGMFHHDSGQNDQARVDIYDPNTKSWSQGADMPTGHSHAEGGTFVHDGRVFILGGMARLGGRRWIDNKIIALVPGGKWKALGDLPMALSSPVACIIKDKLYVGGGSPNGARPQPGMWVRSAPTADKARAPKPGVQINTATEVTLGSGDSGKKATVHYLLSLPENYDKQEKCPLIIFLHGMGERGDNLNRVKVHGPPKIVSKSNATPFIIVSPQCPKTEHWRVDKLSKLLDHILATTKADPKRVYLTGLSMGGFGTWAWAARQPERFAAAIPICGGGDPRTAAKLLKLPIWAFHGGKDKTVPLSRSQSMVDAIKKAGGTKAKLTVYPGVGHNSWTKTYDNPDIYKWLLKHRRAASE